jgi:hypothetical protein
VQVDSAVQAAKALALTLMDWCGVKKRLKG